MVRRTIRLLSGKPNSLFHHVWPKWLKFIHLGQSSLFSWIRSRVIRHAMPSTVKKRKYDESYIQYGFTRLTKDGIDLPRCVPCLKILANSSMKPFRLSSIWKKNHEEQANKPIEYSKNKKEGVKRSRLDTAGAFNQTLIIGSFWC